MTFFNCEKLNKCIWPCLITDLNKPCNLKDLISLLDLRCNILGVWVFKSVQLNFSDRRRIKKAIQNATKFKFRTNFVEGTTLWYVSTNIRSEEIRTPTIVQCSSRKTSELIVFGKDKIHVFGFQLDSADEQAAAIRRELDGRMQKVSEMEKVYTYVCFFVFFHVL